MIDGTFTLVARDPAVGEIGLATSTSFPAVGKRVPHFQMGVGLVATQGKTNVFYGTMGLKLMEIGFSPQESLKILLQQDENREYRQVLMSDLSGQWAVHTGELTEKIHGHLIIPNCVAMGNTLPGKQVLEAMANGFESASGELVWRLMGGLQKGQEAGGDREGKRSAALLVLSPRQFPAWGPLIDLRVDFDPDPVLKLKELLELYLAWEKEKISNIDKRPYKFKADQK